MVKVQSNEIQRKDTIGSMESIKLPDAPFNTNQQQFFFESNKATSIIPETPFASNNNVNVIKTVNMNNVQLTTSHKSSADSDVTKKSPAISQINQSNKNVSELNEDQSLFKHIYKSNATQEFCEQNNFISGDMNISNIVMGGLDDNSNILGKDELDNFMGDNIDANLKNEFNIGNKVINEESKEDSIKEVVTEEPVFNYSNRPSINNLNESQTNNNKSVVRKNSQEEVSILNASVKLSKKF